MWFLRQEDVSFTPVLHGRLEKYIKNLYASKTAKTERAEVALCYCWFLFLFRGSSRTYSFFKYYSSRQIASCGKNKNNKQFAPEVITDPNF